MVTYAALRAKHIFYGHLLFMQNLMGTVESDKVGFGGAAANAAFGPLRREPLHFSLNDEKMSPIYQDEWEVNARNATRNSGKSRA